MGTLRKLEAVVGKLTKQGLQKLPIQSYAVLHELSHALQVSPSSGPDMVT